MSITLLSNTPIEKHEGVWVKREDLCAPPGAPPFSKIRGLVKYLETLKKQEYKGVAYVETSISMAGWGVAWACYHLGLKCLIFNPVYKKPFPLLEYHRAQWARWGAELIDIPAGRAKVNYYIARKQVEKDYKLLPLGLPLEETVEETCKEAWACMADFPSVVVSVGSGTIAAGLYKATDRGQTLYGILCRSGDIELKRKAILNKARPLLLDYPKGDLKLIDMDWAYTEASRCDPPFPCHPYYDAKAWEWLMAHKTELHAPILFWNIGSTGEFQLN